MLWELFSDFMWDFRHLEGRFRQKELEKILFEFLPECIENALCWRRLDHQKVEQAVWLAEDQNVLRKILAENHWVAFAANGSILPRKSGVSELPMAGSVPFQSPDTLEKVIELPHRGKVSGMAIPEGITLIVGGGYHGKSTLLEALQNGVYDHIGGDGRELVITDETAVKLRAEDGRSVRNVDISMFINDLPNGRDTSCFQRWMPAAVLPRQPELWRVWKQGPDCF